MSHKKPIELTLRAIILAIILTALLAISNAYLALKLGILTSASIPAAIISMGVLRFFKNSTIQENNAVQTAASAGEAVAGGIVYTIPALVIIGFWHGFDYFTNFLIAAIGGALGVLFSIPLRRILVHDRNLRFPEGQAIAQVLKSQVEKVGFRDLTIGGFIGIVLEFFQVGFKILANSWSYWFGVKRAIFGFGVGFSATMIGAGLLIGFDMAISIFIGAIIAWFIGLPILSISMPDITTKFSPDVAATLLWNSEMRYLGIGAMIFAGVWTFLNLVKPLFKSIRASFISHATFKKNNQQIPRVEQDIPFGYILCGVFLLAAIMFLFFQYQFPSNTVGFSSEFTPTIAFGAVLYVLIIGFLFSVITAYFSGMVGVTASPGSSIVIAGILFASWILLLLVNKFVPSPMGEEQTNAAMAIVIIIGSVVTGIAAIANDNTQDLKVGQLVGATPWRQQVMLLLGVFVAALVIPPVMQVLFEVYGIADVVPHSGMDLSQTLPAPTAALLAAVSEAVFLHALPWKMMLVGALIILGIIVLNRLFNINRFFKLSILGVAIGMYLPISSTIPLFIGGLIAFIVTKNLKRSHLPKEKRKANSHTATLIACGLVAGAAIADVLLAVPFSIYHSPDSLVLVDKSWKTMGIILSIITTIGLGVWINKRVVR